MEKADVRIRSVIERQDLRGCLCGSAGPVRFVRRRPSGVL